MTQNSRSAQQDRRREIASAPTLDGEGVKSAVRVLRILEFFDQIQRDARVSEIVERLSFPQSSTSALLRSLVRAGYLDYSPATRTYAPTARVVLLGAWVGGSPMRDGSLLRMMEELSAETGETVLLSSPNGVFAQYIYVIQATNSMRLHVLLGSQRPLVWSASGTALLSDASEETVRLLVRRTNAEAPPGQKPIDVRQTLANLDLYRKQGYFFSRGMVVQGAGVLAMRLPETSGNPGRPLAIGIGGLSETIEKSEKRIVSLMRDAIGRYVSHGAPRRKKMVARKSEG